MTAHEEASLDPVTLRVLAREWHALADGHLRAGDQMEAVRARKIANDLDRRACNARQRRRRQKKGAKR